MNVLDRPFKILCRHYDNDMMTAGIIAWKEDLQHLEYQLQRVQVGTYSGYDVRQKKKDTEAEGNAENIFCTSIHHGGERGG